MAKNRRGGVIAFPDSRGGVPSEPSRAAETIADQSSHRDAPARRVILLGEVLFHREALAHALRAYDDVAVVASVAGVHAALMLAQEDRADVLLVDSPSEAAARALADHSPTCKVVIIGGVGELCNQLGGRGAAILVGASSSLDEVHASLRFTSAPPRAEAGAESNLTFREREISRLVATGHSNKEIADACGISIATVKNHMHRILGKLKYQRRSQIGQIADLATNRPKG